ncbi:MAG: transporter substrate-binding domain-containing protein [Haliea sp.]|jgi:polar amino acid transport system substrate-binding protein|nr:transporter substrate-binding domain-containing protein [Haliea sp.]
MLRFALLLVATLVLGSTGVSAEQPLRLMANTSPPYADPKLPGEGLALELVRDVFARTGHKPEITIENWSRAVEGARLGVYDGLAAAWYSEERAQDLLYSEPYLRSELIVLKRRGDQNDYSALGDLSGGRLGVRVDYAYGVDFDSVPNLSLVKENHLIQNLLNLLNGKVDFVIGDQRTIILQLHEFLADKVTQFEVTGITLPPVARHVAVSRSLKGHEKIIADFNRGLAQAKKDGSHGAIVGRWDERYGGLE